MGWLAQLYRLPGATFSHQEEDKGVDVIDNWSPHRHLVFDIPHSTKCFQSSFFIKIYGEGQKCAGCVLRGGSGNILPRTDITPFWQETNVSFKCCISHIGNCNEFLCTFLPSSQCQAQALKHLRLSSQIKCNVTPSSRTVHKSSIWFAWTIASSSLLDKYKPSAEYYVRDRRKAIWGP